MTTVVATKGWPGAGKTTWAVAEVAKYPGRAIRVNMDDLRAMLYGVSKPTPAKERVMISCRDAIIRHAISEGIQTIIVDDVNMRPGALEGVQELAESNGAAFRIKDFTDVPKEECVQRARKRSKEAKASGSPRS